MHAFLTSSPCLFDDNGRPLACLNEANGFVQALAAVLPDHAQVLLIASDPDCPPMTLGMATDLHTAFAAAGLKCAPFETLDGRNGAEAAELVKQADCIILAGGHVPTQNAFFACIGLREALKSFDGVLIGISAGTMNAAETVYAMPEEPGEACDANYERWLEGLGLTKTIVVPHWQRICNGSLDGLRNLRILRLSIAPSTH